MPESISVEKIKAAIQSGSTSLYIFSRFSEKELRDIARSLGLLGGGAGSQSAGGCGCGEIGQ